jgi:hypothetical protein
MTAPWRTRRQRVPDGRIPFLWFAALPPPYGPDPIVFGPQRPAGEQPYCAGPEQSCERHPGVTWRGGGGCWACAGGVSEFSSLTDG